MGQEGVGWSGTTSLQDSGVSLVPFPRLLRLKVMTLLRSTNKEAHCLPPLGKEKHSRKSQCGQGDALLDLLERSL